MAGLRDRIGAVDDRREQTVPVPEWDGVTLLVRSMTLGERNDIIAESRGESGVDLQRMYPLVVIATALDPEDRQPVFGPEDEGFLNGRNPGVVDRIALLAMSLSGMVNKEGKYDPNAAVEESGKGSSSTDADG